MRRNLIVLVIILGIVLPGLLFDKRTNEDSAQPYEMETVAAMETAFSIKVKDNGQIAEMELEEYVTGVLLGEMPASFEMEALKAQAVATRTYTLRKILKQGKHNDADICTDANCCQAFVSVNDYLLQKGTQADVEKIASAVRDTKSEVLTYNGELIEATYFSCSGGVTEDAVAVWGSSVPYLRSVESPGEDQSKHFETTKTLTKSEFLSALSLPSGKPLNDGDLTFSYTEGSGVDTMMLFGSTYSGTQVRQLLNLPSTAFSVTIDEDQVYIRSRGFGHRVGMSQYGADAMAVNGSTYDEILLHYYVGTSLVRLSENDLNGLFDKDTNL